MGTPARTSTTATSMTRAGSVPGSSPNSKDYRGVDLISDALPYGRLWYAEPNAVSNAIGYVAFRSRSDDDVIRVCDEAGNVLETRDHTGYFKEW